MGSVSIEGVLIRASFARAVPRMGSPLAMTVAQPVAERKARIGGWRGGQIRGLRTRILREGDVPDSAWAPCLNFGGSARIVSLSPICCRNTAKPSTTPPSVSSRARVRGSHLEKHRRDTPATIPALPCPQLSASSRWPQNYLRRTLARALGELAGNAFPAPARGGHCVHEVGSSWNLRRPWRGRRC